MDEYNQILFLAFLLIVVSFLTGRFTSNKSKTIKLPKAKLRFNQFSIDERHVINEAVIYKLREYNFIPNKNGIELKKHKALSNLKEELKVFVR